MELIVKRRFRGPEYTIGTLYVDGARFCDTLENTVRDLAKEAKVYGQTAIPEGTYGVVLKRSPRFGRVLPRLLDVPHFEGILIHAGNTARDTAGCILVGENSVKGRVVNSRHWEQRLVETLRTQKNIRITVK